jgi:hypothetical protein
MITTLLRKSLPLAVSVSVLLTSALTPGCGGEPATVEEVCNTCSTDSKSIQTCIKDTTSDQDVLTKIGCGSEFQELLDCLRDEAKCLTGTPESEAACASDRIAILSCAGAI